MKLDSFRHYDNYMFELSFEDGLKKTVDLGRLIASKVSVKDLSTAHIDRDWGCLEFNGGMVDIDPKTLYSYVLKTAT